MNKPERELLEQEQKTLMYRYRQCEAMQTDFSYDLDFYNYAERQMQNLNDEAESIRGLIEGRWNE